MNLSRKLKRNMNLDKTNRRKNRSQRSVSEMQFHKKKPESSIEGDNLEHHFQQQQQQKQPKIDNKLEAIFKGPKSIKISKRNKIRHRKKINKYRSYARINRTNRRKKAIKCSLLENNDLIKMELPNELSHDPDIRNYRLSEPPEDMVPQVELFLKKFDTDSLTLIWQHMINDHPFDNDQLSHLRKIIDGRIRFDIISHLPYEIALYIMSFLSPEDLCQAALTCKSWKTVCEDSMLWRERCAEQGILDDTMALESIFKDRLIRSQAKHGEIVRLSLNDVPKSQWKTAYIKHFNILRNWRTRNFEIPDVLNMMDASSFKIESPKYSQSEEQNPSLSDSASSSDVGDMMDQYSKSDYSHVVLSVKHLKQLRCHEESVITCLQYNPKTNLIVSGSDDQTLKVWCSESGECINTLEGHTGGVWSSQLSPEDIVISGSTDRTIRVWEARSGKLIHTLIGHTSTVRCLALQGNQVVSGSRDTTLRLWDIETGRCENVFTGHSAAVRCVEFKGDTIVSGAYDHLVMVWDAKTGLSRYALECHTNRIYSLQFDGRIIASGSLDSTICIWDANDGKLIHHLEGHTSLTSKMQLKGNLLVSANADSSCKVWNLTTGECLHTLTGLKKHTSAITSVHFNNDHVVTSSDDGTVKLWDIKTGKFLRDLVVLPTATKGGVVWRIRASYTKLICAVGSRTQAEDTHLLVLDFEDH